METVVRAERDGAVAEVYVVPGVAVSPKDLLVRLSA
jgi:biotin carboxyl carrier protein